MIDCAGGAQAGPVGRGCAKLPASGVRGRLVRAEEQCKNSARQYVLLGERRTIIDNRAMDNRAMPLG
jgi:hypothetical protein